MALDTRDKRASALAGGLAPLVVYPLPDSAISAADRIHAAWLYRGIETAVPDEEVCRIVRLNQRCVEQARGELFEVEVISSTAATDYTLLQVDILFAVVT